MTNQGDLQDSVRRLTSTTNDYNGDWHALFDLDSIAAGEYNERLILWLQNQIGSSTTDLNGLMQEYAEAQGAYNWNSINSISVSPLDLAGLQLWLDATDSSTVTVATGVSQWDDKSGNNYNATQGTATEQPAYTTGVQVTLDGVNDNMNVTFGGAVQGTAIASHANVVISYKVDTPAAWNLDESPLYVIDGGVYKQQVVYNRDLLPSERTQIKNYFVRNGGSDDWLSVSSLGSWFRDRTDIVEIYTNDWDTTNITNCNNFVKGCSSLTTLDVSNWDTSSVTNFFAFARETSSLTELDVSNWDTSSAVSFGAFIQDSTSITTLDVSNWDTSSVTHFFAFASNASSLTQLDVSNWDTSSVTAIYAFVSNASSLTTLDLSNWDTSSMASCNNFAFGCSSLTTVTVTGGTGNPFADSPCTQYTNAFHDTNLTQQSIDDILVAINAAGTSSGTFNQSGGSSPSSTGETAIDGLRARGWTITVTGGY